MHDEASRASEGGSGGRRFSLGRTPKGIEQAVQEEEEEEEGEEPPEFDLGRPSQSPILASSTSTRTPSLAGSPASVLHPPSSTTAPLTALPSSLPFLTSPISPPLLPLPSHPSTNPTSSLLSTLKRHTRLATASYGLHTYIVDPPTPLLTPSGRTLPHRLFAHLGGMNDHRDLLFVALQRRGDGGDEEGGIGKGEGGELERAQTPYAPQIYLLRDDAVGEVVVVIRGTQSLADVCVNLLLPLFSDSSFSFLPSPSVLFPQSGRPLTLLIAYSTAAPISTATLSTSPSPVLTRPPRPLRLLPPPPPPPPPLHLPTASTPASSPPANTSSVSPPLPAPPPPPPPPSSTSS